MFDEMTADDLVAYRRLTRVSSYIKMTRFSYSDGARAALGPYEMEQRAWDACDVVRDAIFRIIAQNR